MKKSNLMPSLVLGCICLVVALLLSAVNMVTAPVIQKLQNDKAAASFTEVLPGATGKVDLTIDEQYPAIVTAGYKFDNGFVFQMSVTGKSSGLIIMCGISSDGKITGTKVIADQETDSYDANVFPFVEGTDGKYKDMTLEDFDPYLVSGATLTSKAYGEAVKAALQAYVIANGGAVDTRTPEQILRDNCNAALGTEGKTFTRLFESWTGFGTSEVYTTDSGIVIINGESIVGYLNGSNTPVGTPDQAAVAATAAAYTAYASLTKLDLTSYTGLAASVKAVYKNASGEYMFSITRKGFSYAPAPMVIELIINSDGVITSCVTVSHSESGNYGSVCGKPEYYNQYVGKTVETYTEVPNIIATAPGIDPGLTGGATQTSNGYKSAIREAFAAFDIIKTALEGGNN